jgi:hypothetical protein
MVEAMNYAGTFTNGLGSSTFTDILLPVGTQVRRICLVLGFGFEFRGSGF